MPELLLALDAGTSSVRAMLVAPDGRVLATARRRLETHYPGPGRVEQDGDAVWAACRGAIATSFEMAGRTPLDVAAVGVTTQRASIVLWERAGGAAVAPVVIWSDLRGMTRSRVLHEAGFPVWPQVPAAKLEALLESVPDGLRRAEDGHLAWGTLDSWLVFRLTGGGAHVTDASNAWMTGYADFDHPGTWNDALLSFQGLPDRFFPRIADSWGDLATTDASVFGAVVPVTALLADQPAGMIAHAALGDRGWKMTYGTSGVLMACTGAHMVSPHRTMPPEVLCRVAGRTTFAVEGMVISTGTAIDWLCHGLGLFASAEAMEAAACAVSDSGGVIFRPSLQGLGAPHGIAGARGLMDGLTPATQPGHVARAALEGIAMRVREIACTLKAAENFALPDALPIDGGLSANSEFLQIQADLLGMPVRRHAVREATAYGAALAAGLGAGLLQTADLVTRAHYDREFLPRISAEEADARYAAWAAAVQLAP